MSIGQRVSQFASALVSAARRGNTVASITGGSYGAGTYFGQYQQTLAGGIDWNEATSLRYNSSIVFSIISFAVRQIEAIPLETYWDLGGNKYELIEHHPATVLLERPNPWYDGTDLSQLSVFTEMAWGNSYAYKHRHPRTNKVIALEFLPENSCYPYTWPGTGEFVSEYRVSTVNGYYRIPPCDILHMRYMMDPVWPVYGMSPLYAAIPELASDMLAARHEAAILANGAVASALITPKQYPSNYTAEDSFQPIFEFGPGQAKQLENRFRQQLTRDGKGSVLVSNIPLEVGQLQFDPKSLGLEYTTGKAEQRLCAVFGIQPVVVGMGTGLRESNNRASIEAAIDLTFRSFVIPYARRRARQLTSNLIPELGKNGQVIMYDESKIEALKDILLKEIAVLCGVPPLTPDEGRARIGMGKVDGGDQIQVPKGTRPMGQAEGTQRQAAEAPKDPTTAMVDNGDGNQLAGPGEGVLADQDD